MGSPTGSCSDSISRVVTGSFNWTGPAENRNRENLLVLDCPALVGSYAAEWETIRPEAA